MVTIALVMDNRPEAVSSAHWGDVSTASSAATFVEATLKLLATHASGFAVQGKDAQNSPGSMTLVSRNAEIRQSQRNKSSREETRI